jgi:hypothetical protein
MLWAGLLNKAELGGGNRGGNDHPAAGEFPIEFGQGHGVEFGLDDVGDDLGFAEWHRRFGGGFNLSGWLPRRGDPGEEQQNTRLGE